MRKQYPIYVETSLGSVRNKAINNVNISTDICAFSEPEFYVSGATKIPFSIETCDLSGTSFSGMIATVSATCFSAYSFSTCFCGLTWSNEFYANSEIVYSGDILSTVSSSNTLTQGIYDNSVYTGLIGLGYTYTTSGTGISVSKPYGINSLELDLCLDMTYNTACTSGTCGVCVNACTLTYPYMTSASTGVYFFGKEASSIDFNFVFTGGMDSFDVVNSSDTTFKYGIYKYNAESFGFSLPAIYSSGEIQYSAISATSSVTITVSSTTLGLDGDYLIKGGFVYNTCTDILKRLGVRVDTSQYANGSLYSLYNEDLDYYFVGLTSAMTPTFLSSFNQLGYGRLVGFSMFPYYSGQTAMTFNANFISDPIVALNGLVLANNIDYVLSATTVTFVDTLKTTDVVTMIGTIGSTYVAIHNDLITVTNPIASGATDGEGSNSVYYNTTTSKYETYATITPLNGNQMIISLNGVVLAPNIDYYQSISNSKRFILEGTIVVGDVINLYYLPITNVVDSVYTNDVSITWEISVAPQLINGEFTLEVSTGTSFTTLIASAITPYSIGITVYQATVSLTGTYNSYLYYRVKNVKNYQNLTGDIISSEAYSETIPIIIATNAINSY